jgi:hypothetical protein
VSLIAITGLYGVLTMSSEMFLGPAGPGFQFQPKHKSNSYEIEAEG